MAEGREATEGKLDVTDSYVQQAVSVVLLAEPGANITVRVPVGHGCTQAMLLACSQAKRPLIVSRTAKRVVDELWLMREGRGRPIPDPFVLPAYVRIVHPISCTWELLHGYAPDLIIVKDPSPKPSKCTRAIVDYSKRGVGATAIIVEFKS